MGWLVRAALLLAALWLAWHLLKPLFAGDSDRPDRRALDDARSLLGVGSEATADEIRAAHRRLIERVHPDKGGTDALTQRVNAARDLLLAAAESLQRDN